MRRVWAAVALLAFTALGNVGQAQSWASSRVTFTSGLKTSVLAAGKLLGSGVQDVSGPGAAPINFDPNLSASALGDLQRSGWLPRARAHPARTGKCTHSPRCWRLERLGHFPDAPGAVHRENFPTKRPVLRGHSLVPGTA